MTMTVHNYRLRQFHRTSNGEHPSSGYRDMGSASLAAARPEGGGVKSQWSVLLAFSVGNPLVTGEFFSQWTINKDIRTKSWWLSSQCVIIHKSSKRCTNILCHRNNDKRRHQKNTYLCILENIHPNHNPLSKSLMLWSNTNANFRYYHISLIMHMWKQVNNISWYCGNQDLISPDHGEHPSESSGTLLMHLSEYHARKNNVLFHKLQAAGISVVTESLFGFTKLILHHPRAVTAASRGSTIAHLALRITHQPEPYILWSRFTHTLPCLTLISTVWALVCATAPPVRSPAKASAILNESVTAVTASRFSPVKILRPQKWRPFMKCQIIEHNYYFILNDKRSLKPYKKKYCCVDDVIDDVTEWHQIRPFIYKWDIHCLHGNWERTKISSLNLVYACIIALWLCLYQLVLMTSLRASSSPKPNLNF